MLSTPEGWVVIASQPAVVAVRGASRMVIEEGLRFVDPAALLAELKQSALGVERLDAAMTDEGELAAFARGRIADVEMVLGFVFLDGSYVRVVGETHDD